MQITKKKTSQQQMRTRDKTTRTKQKTEDKKLSTKRGESQRYWRHGNLRRMRKKSNSNSSSSSTWTKASTIALNYFIANKLPKHNATEFHFTMTQWNRKSLIWMINFVNIFEWPTLRSHLFWSWRRCSEFDFTFIIVFDRMTFVFKWKTFTESMNFFQIVNGKSKFNWYHSNQSS